MKRRIWGSFAGSSFTRAKIFSDTCWSRTMSAETAASSMLSSRRFISAMARRPSLSILSRSALPVDSSLGFSWAFSVFSASGTPVLAQRAVSSRKATAEITPTMRK